MDYNSINNLLDKYWEGQTSLEEEQQLKNYFNQTEIAEEHLVYQGLFQEFDTNAQLELSDDFDKKLFQKIDAPTPVRRLSHWNPILKIAASVLIVISMFTYYYDGRNDFDDLKKREAIEAYEKTKAALLLVSGKMKKGTRQANEGIAKLRLPKTISK